MTDKSDQTLAWMIEVSERRLGGSPLSRRYFVAVADESTALIAVRRASETVNPTIRTKRKITDPKVLSLLNLNRGKLIRTS